MQSFVHAWLTILCVRRGMTAWCARVRSQARRRWPRLHIDVMLWLISMTTVPTKSSDSACRCAKWCNKSNLCRWRKGRQTESKTGRQTDQRTDRLTDWPIICLTVLTQRLTDLLIDRITDPLPVWLTCWLPDRLPDWLVDLTAWLTDLLPDRLLDWLVDCQTDLLTAWPTARLTGWLPDRLPDWLVDLTARLANLLPDRLPDWLADCLTKMIYQQIYWLLDDIRSLFRTSVRFCGLYVHTSNLLMK